MINGTIFLESMLDLVPMSLILGMVIVVISTGRQLWLVWKGNE